MSTPQTGRINSPTTAACFKFTTATWLHSNRLSQSSKPTTRQSVSQEVGQPAEKLKLAKDPRRSSMCAESDRQADLEETEVTGSWSVCPLRALSQCRDGRHSDTVGNSLPQQNVILQQHFYKPVFSKDQLTIYCFCSKLKQPPDLRAFCITSKTMPFSWAFNHIRSGFHPVTTEGIS